MLPQEECFAELLQEPHKRRWDFFLLYKKKLRTVKWWKLKANKLVVRYFFNSKVQAEIAKYGKYEVSMTSLYVFTVQQNEKHKKSKCSVLVLLLSSF